MNSMATWQTYGIDSRGQEKYYLIDDEALIHFAPAKKFCMDANLFVELIKRANEIPVTEESNTDEIPVGEDSRFTYSMSRTVNHDLGDEEQVGISIRAGGKWVGWIRLTPNEINYILNGITKFISEQN